MLIGWLLGCGAMSLASRGLGAAFSAARFAGARACALAWLLPWLCLSVLSSCQWGGNSDLEGSLLRGLAPVASAGVSAPQRLTDGVSAVPGGDWDTDVNALFDGEDAFVTFDLGKSVTLHGVWFTADHNDQYRFLLSEDGEVFEPLWDAPTVRAMGMQDRANNHLEAKGRYLRLEPVQGDGRYAVAELAVFGVLPSPFPPEVSRRRGMALQTVVRTKVLLFAGGCVAFLLLTFAGAPLWWLVLCALLPLVAGVEAVQSMARAWPVEQRGVSLVRAASAAIAAAAILRELYAPPRLPAWRPAVLSCLGGAALIAVLAFYNLGRPQFWDGQKQQPTFVHMLDLRQYFQTVKYFDELGYRDMYLADMAAYAEDVPGATLENLRDTPMRDLSTHRMTTIGEQRARIEGIKQRFTAERWQEYKKDARYFREMMGQRDYLKYMFDFGGNATPVWITIAHYLFSAFSANTTAFLITGLLDPLLFLVTFGAIGWCFGFRTMCVVMVVFGANDFIMYGSNWAGATLRHDWLMYIGLAACALQRKRHALAGVLLALSTLIRAFPAITLVTASFPALWWIVEYMRAQQRRPTWKELREAHEPTLRLLGAALVTGVLLVGVTTLRWHWLAWSDWFWKVAKLSADPHANSVALRGLVAGWEIGHHALLAARMPMYIAAIAFYLAGVVLVARQRALEQAAILGLLLVPVVFYAANYYIHVVCLLPLLVRERRGPDGATLLSPTDGWIWLTLLGLCIAQYWTVLVDDMPVHFHQSTVLLFGALTALLVALVRGDVREGRLDFLVRYFSARPGEGSPQAP
ncbi:MAG: hypothetical protein RL033_5022 [Pseudomonadota bacterium]